MLSKVWYFKELSIGLAAVAVFLLSFSFLSCGLTPKYFEFARSRSSSNVFLL